MLRETRDLMGMPVTVALADGRALQRDIDDAYAFFAYVDRTFSTFKPDSVISRMNAGTANADEWNDDVREVFALAEKTKRETDGFFDIMRGDFCDPSGIVKGWAIRRVALLLRDRGYKNFFVDAGGDIAAFGNNERGRPWRVGIRSPFDANVIVKTLALSGVGVATSGTYLRGEHIYNPRAGCKHPPKDIVSLTVVGPDVLEADRFATAAFAMGREGIYFLEERDGLEGFAIDVNGLGTETTGFSSFLHRP